MFINFQDLEHLIKPTPLKSAFYNGKLKNDIGGGHSAAGESSTYASVLASNMYYAITVSNIVQITKSRKFSKSTLNGLQKNVQSFLMGLYGSREITDQKALTVLLDTLYIFKIKCIFPLPNKMVAHELLLNGLMQGPPLLQCHSHLTLPL